MEGDEVLKVDEAKNGNRRPRGNGGPPPAAARGHAGPRGRRKPAAIRRDGGARSLERTSTTSPFSEAVGKDPWMLQFGGHHLALNITIAGEHGVLTPTSDGRAARALHERWKDDTALGRRRATRRWPCCNALDEGSGSKRFSATGSADLVSVRDRTARRLFRKD